MSNKFMLKAVSLLLAVAIVVGVMPLALAASPAAAAEAVEVQEVEQGVVFEDENGDGVRNEGEAGIEGIAVSNGVEVVATDESGCYQLPVAEYFIYITVPRDYIATTPWYRSTTGGDFGLKYDEAKDTDEFTFIQLTDIHLENKEEMEVFFAQAIDEINNINPAFVVITGDLVNGADTQTVETAREWFNAYANLIEGFNMPVYNMVGNHDVVGIHNYHVSRRDPGYNKAIYRSYFGPTYYSFDWGDYHCLALDPNQLIQLIIIRHQYYAIDDDQLEWLSQDLALSQDKPLLVFFHEPSSSWRNRAEVLDLLDEHEAMLFSGHWHQDILLNSLGLPEQVTGALCGEWWQGDCPDGEPQGYRIVSIDSRDIDTFYKGVGEARRINITSPEPVVSGEAELTAQIYSQDGDISAACYRIDDGEPIPMQLQPGLWTTATALWDTTHLASGYHAITIEATDRTGTFSETIEVKVTDESIVPLEEVVSHFESYQGSYTYIEARVWLGISLMGTGGVLLTDATGGMVVFWEVSPPLPFLIPGDWVRAKAVPLEFSRDFLQASGWGPIIEYFGWLLPPGLLEIDPVTGEWTGLKLMRLLSGEDLTKMR